jgi:hypothetical protein
MIEVVTREKFYKDVAHEPLRPTVSKDPRAHRAGSSNHVAAPSHTTYSGGASSAPSVNSSILKMFRGIFAMYRRMDVMEQRLQIVRCNQEIIHSQRDKLLLEFPGVHVFPPVPDPDPYASLTPTELAMFGIGHARVDDDDNGEEEEEAHDDEETEDDE